MKVLVAALLLLVVFARPGTADSAGQTLSAVEGSSETLAETMSVNPLTRTVLYSVPVTVTDGDRVQVHGRAQVTNDLGFNVMVGFEVRRTSGPSETVGPWVVRATAENVTPAMHHIVRVGQGWDVPPAGVHYYNVIVYAAASRSSEGDVVTVDPYGAVEVAVFSG